jgi:hypothetical protein
MRALLCCFATAVIGITFFQSGAGAGEAKKKGGKPSGAWTDDFSAERADLISTGRNPYFTLEPGFQRLLEGGNERFVNTVFNETKMVVSETVKTPAGEFKNCLKIKETTPTEPGNVGYKYYAPGVGLIQDGQCKLVSYGKAKASQ